MQGRRCVVGLVIGFVLGACGATAAAPTATPLPTAKASLVPFREVLVRPHSRTIFGGTARIAFGPDDHADEGQWSLRYQNGREGSGRIVDPSEQRLVWAYLADHGGAQVSFGVVLTPDIERVQLTLTTGDVAEVDVVDGLFYLQHPEDVSVQDVTLIHRDGARKSVEDF